MNTPDQFFASAEFVIYVNEQTWRCLPGRILLIFQALSIKLALPLSRPNNADQGREFTSRVYLAATRPFCTSQRTVCSPTTTSSPTRSARATSTSHSTTSLSCQHSCALDSVIHAITSNKGRTKVVIASSVLRKGLSQLLSLLDTVERKAPVVARWPVWIFPDDVAESIDVLYFLTVGILVVTSDHLGIEIADVFLQLRACLVACRLSMMRPNKVS